MKFYIIKNYAKNALELIFFKLKNYYIVHTSNCSQYKNAIQ
jgi:hypothetical protein